MPDSTFSSLSRRSLSRRSALAGLTGLGAVALAGCQTGDGGSSDDSSTDGTLDGGVFPRTITHAFGETTIDSAPERVATVSWANQDAALALGVVPVGMPSVEFGGNDNGSTDWFDDRLEEIGGEAPEQYSEADGIDFEAIAALTPDVILGVYSGLTQEDYDKLSEIAPTIAYPEGTMAFGTSWQDTTRGLGLDEKADELVAELEGKVAEAVEANPVLSGKTFIYGTVDPEAEDEISIYTSIDNRPRFLSSLEMEQAPVIVEEEGSDPESFFITWSPERADELDSDILISWAASEDVREAIDSDDLLSRIPAVADGRLLLQTDGQETLSVSAISPLSLPWALETVLPQIVATLEGGGAEDSPSA